MFINVNRFLFEVNKMFVEVSKMSSQGAEQSIGVWTAYSTYHKNPETLKDSTNIIQN